MPLSNERARELAQLEPPRSIERMIRFLADVGQRVPGLPPLTPGVAPETLETAPGAPGIGLAGQRARAFAARLTAQNNSAGAADPLPALMARYQMGVADVQQFTLWLALWNDKRLETETVVIRDMALARPPHGAGQTDTADTAQAAFPSRRLQRMGTRRGAETGGETDEEGVYEEDIYQDSSIQETPRRVGDGSARPLARRGVSDRRRRIEATETLQERRQQNSAEPDTLSRAWRGGREEAPPLRLRPAGSLPPPATGTPLSPDAAAMLPRSAPGLGGQAASPLSASLASEEGLSAASAAPGAASSAGMDPLVLAQSPSSTRAILQRTVWGANLMGVGFLSGLALGQGNAGNSLPSALNPAFAPLGRSAEGFGAQSARPDLDFTLSRPPLPVPSYLGVAIPPPDTNVERERQAWRPPFDGSAPERVSVSAPQVVSSVAPASAASAPLPRLQAPSSQVPADDTFFNSAGAVPAQGNLEDRPTRLPKQAADAGAEETQEQTQPAPASSAPGRTASPFPALANAIALFGLPAASAAMLALAGLFAGSGRAAIPASAAGASAAGSRAVSASIATGLPSLTALAGGTGAASSGVADSTWFTGLPGTETPASLNLFGLPQPQTRSTGNANYSGAVQAGAITPFRQSVLQSGRGDMGLAASAGSPVLLRQGSLLGAQGALPPAQIGMGYVDLLSGQTARLGAQSSSAAQAFLPPGQMGLVASGAGTDGTAVGQDANAPLYRAFSLRPEMGQVTLIAPPLNVASEQAEQGGVATAFDWQTLAQGTGPLTESGWAQLKDALPASAQIIYPALPAGSAGVNLPLAPALLGRLMEQGYTPQMASRASEASQMGAQVASRARASAALPGRIVPVKAPMGRQTGLLASGAAPTAAGPLAEAGQGQAKRGGALDFLGMPVSLAPSLSGKSELSEEVAARRGSSETGAPTLVRPQQFSPLRDRLFPTFQSVTAEMDKPAWDKAAPNYGLRDSNPATLLSPDARVSIPTATSPLPQMQGGEGVSRLSPILDRALAATSPQAPRGAAALASAISGKLPGQGSGSISSIGSSAGSAGYAPFAETGQERPLPSYGSYGRHDTPAAYRPGAAGAYGAAALERGVANSLPGDALSPARASLMPHFPDTAPDAAGASAGWRAPAASMSSPDFLNASLRPFPTVSGLQNQRLTPQSGDMLTRPVWNRSVEPFAPSSLTMPNAGSASSSYSGTPRHATAPSTRPPIAAPRTRGHDGILPVTSLAGFPAPSPLPAYRETASDTAGLNPSPTLSGHDGVGRAAPIHSGVFPRKIPSILNGPSYGANRMAPLSTGHFPMLDGLPAASPILPLSSRSPIPLPAAHSGGSPGGAMPLPIGSLPTPGMAGLNGLVGSAGSAGSGSALASSDTAKPPPILPIFTGFPSTALAPSEAVSPARSLTLPGWTTASANGGSPAMRAVSTITERLADRAPTMTLPSMQNGRGQSARRNDAAPLTIQRSITGASPQSPAAEKAAQPPRASALAAGENQAKANEVHLLANEVWALLKRRMSWEAERRGRW